MPKSKTKKTTTKKNIKTKSVDSIEPESLKLADWLPKRSRKSKKGHGSEPKVMGGFRLFGRSIQNLTDHWPQFGILLVIFLLLNLFFVSGLSNLTSTSELKTDASSIFHGTGSHITAGADFIGSLLGSNNSSASPTASTYQIIFILLFSLIVIWSLRVVLSAKRLKISDAFYKSLYPLVPAILIALLIAVELIPLLIGAYIYGVVSTNSLSVNVFQDLVWLIVFAGLAFLSLYLITSAAIAFYIVTLPDMRPMAALSSARKLVKHRRLLVMRKILFLPICLVVIGFFILVPFAEVVPGGAYWLYLILLSIGLFIAHSYMYTLYRELL